MKKLLCVKTEHGVQSGKVIYKGKEYTTQPSASGIQAFIAVHIDDQWRRFRASCFAQEYYP